MRKNKNPLYKKIRAMIENPYIIITSLTTVFVIFSLYHILMQKIEMPSIYSTILFVFSIAFLIVMYTLLKKKEDKRILLWIFIISLTFEILIFLAMPMDTSKWSDARGYHNLAILTAEKGPIYLIENYHRLMSWNSSFCSDAKERLQNIVKNEELFGFIEEKLQVQNELNLSVYNFTDYRADRTGIHPPGWILTLYLFVLFFGRTEIVMILAEFALASIASMVVYWFLRKHADFNVSLFLTFLFMLMPSFIIYSASPLMDIPITITIILSIFFYSELMKTNRIRHLIEASLLFSIALFTKFISIFFYFLFLLITIINKGKKINFLVFLMISITPMLLLTFLNYHYFLNTISSFIFASCAQEKLGAPNWLFFIIRFPKEIITLLSIPLIYLIAMGILKILFSKKKSEREKIIFAYLGCFFLFGFLVGMGISRLLFMFSPLLLLAITCTKKKFTTSFVYFSIVGSSIQLFILLIFNVLNV